MATIRCNVKKNLFYRFGRLSTLVYRGQYDFSKFFLIVNGEEVCEYIKKQNEPKKYSLFAAACEIFLYKMFGWTEYDEEKYANLLEMPILDLYDTLSIAYKNYLIKKKEQNLNEDF